MSDERDSVDAAADGVEDRGTGNRGGQTAVVTPQRPSGKRSRQRPVTATVEDDVEDAVTVDGDASKNGSGTKTKKAKKAASGPSRNPIMFVVTYLKQVVAELRKVIWPNRRQMVNYTTVVLVFLAFMVALIGLVDLGLAKLVLLVFG